MGLAVRRGAFSTRSTRNTWAAPAPATAGALRGPSECVRMPWLTFGMDQWHGGRAGPDATRPRHRALRRRPVDDAPCARGDLPAGCWPHVFAHGVARRTPGRRRSAAILVQPKDIQPPTDHEEPPELFAMRPPRGAGHARDMHKHPVGLMTPAEQREMLVFDKCAQRARLALRKAANDAARTAFLTKLRHPNGVLGAEGPDCAESLVYRDARKAPCHPARPLPNLRHAPPPTHVPLSALASPTSSLNSPLKPHRQPLLLCAPPPHSSHPNFPRILPTPSDRSARSRKRRAPTTPRGGGRTSAGSVTRSSRSRCSSTTRRSATCAEPPTASSRARGRFLAAKAPAIRLTTTRCAPAGRSPRRSVRIKRVLCDAPTGRAARRLQSLINCDSGGRAYDIISNHRKPLRPTIGEAHATRMMHPSNLSLPRGAGTAPRSSAPFPTRTR